MIHPDTRIKPVNDIIGNGVFATKTILKGTIVVVNDPYDISIAHDEFLKLPEIQRASMETYMYQDRHGDFVLSWDHAKYMNHSCNSNTMLTDYDIEIAVRDIQAGEEITSEYGLLNTQEPCDIYCGCENCRQHLYLDDIDRYADIWDRQIKESLLMIFQRPQPLWDILDIDNQHRLETLQKHPEIYRSVRNMKWRANVI